MRGLSSPRPWGCFQNPEAAQVIVLVFPTPVGVFLKIMNPDLIFSRLPHARGGVSQEYLQNEGVNLSSPRPWGCFLFSIRHHAADCVFPTPVGVFLMLKRREALKLSLPHARGGVSH